MITGAAAATDTVRHVVRGESPWTDLIPLGMQGGPQESACQFLPSFPADVRVSVSDLARGFLTYLDDAPKLREWAFVMQAVPANFDVENHPAGETVLDALWNASFGTPLDDEQLAALKELGAEELSRP